MNIGPRLCYILDESGREEEISIYIGSEKGPSQSDQDAASYTGTARVESMDRAETFKVFAADEILLVGRLINIVGCYLLGECARNGGQLSTMDRSSVMQPYDLF